jgi:hypothetical protein
MIIVDLLRPTTALVQGVENPKRDTGVKDGDCLAVQVANLLARNMLCILFLVQYLSNKQNE